VKNFLALARQHPMQRQRVDINSVVREAVELLAYSLRVDTVDVSQNLASDLPVLWGDADELHQVVVNLISNAQQAMRSSASPRKLAITTRHSGDRITLEVADTGPGIPAEVRSRIFEPFFTTKPPGQGTGLGLSLCQSIVERHQGVISVESTPGHGATFTVEIPVGVPPDEVESATRRDTPPLPARRYRILVVDDEADVAELLAEMLAADGHEVDTAGNGAQALARIRERSYEFVFCDMRMPELDGPGLYHQVKQSRPELLNRWIFLTGDALGPDTTVFLDRTRTPTLTKPFGFDDLRRVLVQVAPADWS
jgi:two-component system NtrC family sensor kinase